MNTTGVDPGSAWRTNKRLTLKEWARGTWVAFLALLAGCAFIPAQVQTVDIPLRPHPNSCTAVQVEPGMLSTLSYAVCFDAEGRPIGMVGGEGTSRAAVVSQAGVGAAALGTGALLAGALSNGINVRTPPISLGVPH